VVQKNECHGMEGDSQSISGVTKSEMCGDKHEREPNLLCSSDLLCVEQVFFRILFQFLKRYCSVFSVRIIVKNLLVLKVLLFIY
jgi:hypothetical protein